MAGNTPKSTQQVVRANLVRFRLEARLTLDGAAAALGISRDGLSKIERAERPLPRPDMLQKMADLYGHNSVGDFYMADPPAADLSNVPVIIPMALADVSEEVLEQARRALEPAQQAAPSRGAKFGATADDDDPGHAIAEDACRAAASSLARIGRPLAPGSARHFVLSFLY